MQQSYVTIVVFSRLMTTMTKQKHDQHQSTAVTHDRAESIGSVMCLLVSIIAIAAMIIQSIN